ncbi:hypothetical protein [Brevundimonas denitrificans]|uniref:hypothetical protein n=1 Tax=Brevundimonas denitrificans TaxID=1443434 RepID=UPI00223AA0A2|nr:hypothetical protein [Brevundimonas denitrificans]
MTQLRPFTVSALIAGTALAPLMAVVLVAAPATPVQAQQVPDQPVEWTPRRLNQLDRNVRRLERAVTQRNAAGDPVLIETDPEVVVLQGVMDNMQRRLADLEATVQRMNGDIERLTFANDEAQRDNAAMRRLLTDSNNRITALEGQLEAVAEANAPIVADSPTGDARQDFDRAIRLANAQDVRACAPWKSSSSPGRTSPRRGRQLSPGRSARPGGRPDRRRAGLRLVPVRLAAHLLGA